MRNISGVSITAAESYSSHL